MKKPYIGVTGFVSSNEVELICLEIFQKMVSANHLLMVGVLASSRDMNHRRPNRYPPEDLIPMIFPRRPFLLNLIHYHTNKPEILYEELRWMTDKADANLDGFQLNMSWPNPRTIEKYCRAFSDMKIVLQIGNHALDIVHHSPGLLAEKVKEYDGLIDYVLLDESVGLGKLLDVNKTRRYLDAITETGMDIGLGIAGGLGPATIDHISALLKDFPSLSIDAEGCLRDEKDNLDVDLTLDYLNKSLDFFSSKV